MVPERGHIHEPEKLLVAIKSDGLQPTSHGLHPGSQNNW